MANYLSPFSDLISQLFLSVLIYAFYSCFLNIYFMWALSFWGSISLSQTSKGVWTHHSLHDLWVRIPVSFVPQFSTVIIPAITTLLSNLGTVSMLVLSVTHICLAGQSMWSLIPGLTPHSGQVTNPLCKHLVLPSLTAGHISMFQLCISTTSSRVLLKF